jgi:hypothetical protein
LVVDLLDSLGHSDDAFGVGLTTDLHVDNPAEVVGHSVLRADLGVDGRTIVVMSGIAVPEFEVDNDQTIAGACRVHLGEPGERMEQASIHVGLASISNDDTEFQFEVDAPTLERDPDTDQLALAVPLALNGERSYLHRFSYQVVLLERVVATEITGTLTWETAVFSPASPDPATVARTFSVVAQEGSGFPLGPVIASGTITSVTPAGDLCHAAYRIADPPKDKLLTVVCNSSGLPPELNMAPAVDNINVMTLTAAEPTRAGVDFVMHRSVVA